MLGCLKAAALIFLKGLWESHKGPAASIITHSPSSGLFSTKIKNRDQLVKIEDA